SLARRVGETSLDDSSGKGTTRRDKVNSHPASLPLIRRYRITSSIDEPVEPVKLPIQTLDQMFRFACARQVVILARKHDDLGSHAKMLECAKPLLALFKRHTKVVVCMQDQRRRLDVLRILERRAIPVHVKLLEKVASK